MAEPKRYQYALKAEECKLFRELRLLQKRSTESLAVPDHLQSYVSFCLRDQQTVNGINSQNFDISIHSGSRYLGHFEINAGLGVGIIQEFACVGVDSLKRLLDGKDGQEADLTAAKVTENDDDCDSVLGCDTPIKRSHVADQKSKAKAEPGEPMPFVQIVALTIGKEHVTKSTLMASLREQFPRATIKIDDPKSKGANKSETTTSEENGQLKITPFPTENSETSNLETSSSDALRLDPISHLGDLARYATEEPTDVEFSRKCPVGEVWDILSYSRKLEIAHARAIQGLYGRTMDTGACNHCRKLGWDCRIYQAELVHLSHMDFGYSCQNCRLSQTTCDLPAATSPSHQHLPITPKTRLRINLKNPPAVFESEANDTSSAATASKPSLTPRTTGDHVNKKGATPHPHEDKDATFSGSQGTVVISEEQRRVISSSKDMKILNVAAKIGLQLPDRVPNVIFNMYNQWQLHGEVKPPHKRPLQLQHYYSNLVSLYILAYAKMEMDLCYATLLRFQATNYQSSNNTDLPDVETAVCAFQYLPWDTPLCRWIAILYAFLWGTEIAGDYAAFMKDNPHLDRSALTKLLYSVAYIRDPLTMGHDNAVLARWCDVHDHGKGNEWKSELCDQMQSVIKMSADSRQEMEDARALEEAQKIIERFGSHPAQNKSTASSPASSLGKGKRKVNEPSTYSYKKFKKGGGYDTGW